MATVKENAEVLRKAIGLTARKVVRPRVQAVLHETAEMMIDIIDNEFQPATLKGGGSPQFPIWSGVMHDATGVGVYEFGRLTKYKPTQYAKNGKGLAMLDEAMDLAVADNSKSMRIVLFSEADHAAFINDDGSKWGRGQGFYEVLKKILTQEINLEKESINRSLR